jgi:hypothetical protein
MTTHDDPREELLELAAALRHLRAEHLRTGAGTGVRRHLEIRIHEVTYHLDRRLEARLDGEDDRAAWRHHAHGGAAPDRPARRASAASATPRGAPVG